jgi:effector-binding domain-containing protein
MRYETEFVDLEAQRTAVVCGHVRTEELPEFLGSAFGEVINVLDKQGLHPTGMPFGRYRPTEDGAFDVEVGFPSSDVVEPEGRVEPSELPGGRAARTMHVGSYDDVGAAYEATMSWLIDEGHVASAAPWEYYLDGPEVANPRTEVFMPCEKAHPIQR